MAVPKNTFSKPSNLVGGQVLWGRVLIIGGVLVLAFVVGILIGGSGSDGVSRDAYNGAISQRDKAEQEREQLKQDLQLARSTTPPSTAATDAATESQTYTVEDGDTWSSISKKFYGDSALASEIWEANDMTKDTKLKTGMTLEIPPKPESASTTTTTTKSKSKSKSTTTTTKAKSKSSSSSND